MLKHTPLSQWGEAVLGYRGGKQVVMLRKLLECPYTQEFNPLPSQGLLLTVNIIA
jgi:hypothetical protein